MLLIKKIFFIFFINLFLTNASAEIEIKYKIGDEIITNFDILNEKNYLIFLRPSLKNLSTDEILKISENSLIKEIIKKKEIDKIFKDKDNLKFIEDVKKNIFNYKRVKNEQEFKKLTLKNNIDYEKIIEKIKNEALWNELIYKKYNLLVKIDEAKLKKQLLKKIKSLRKSEYNLSELLFEIDSNDNLDNKYEIIKEYINSNNFKLAATRYSISNSANKGGEIGWIKETLLSENLVKILNKMNINEISKPIKYPNGYLLLKINNKREMKESININKEFKDLVNFEKNKQLNQFSLLYFKKLKKNTVIDAY